MAGAPGVTSHNNPAWSRPNPGTYMPALCRTPAPTQLYRLYLFKITPICQKKRFILGQEFSLSSLSLEMPTSHIKVPGSESQLFSKFHHPANVHLGSETLNPGHSYHWPLNTCFYKFHKYSGILSSVLNERINKHIPKQQRPVSVFEEFRSK